MVKQTLERFGIALGLGVGIFVLVQLIPTLISADNSNEVVAGVVLLIFVFVLIYSVGVDFYNSVIKGKK
jgi:choline-glycine betaine transporter